MHEKTVKLNDLDKCCKLSKARCDSFGEAAAVCLEKFGHFSGIELKIFGDHTGTAILYWDELNQKSYDSWLNLEEAVEDAAYGIAMLVVWNLTPFQIIRQSRKGSKVDFWCCEKESNFLFQNSIKLEVSGILKGSIGQVNYRIKQKLRRAIENKDEEATIIVVIAEFSKPIAKTKIQQ